MGVGCIVTRGDDEVGWWWGNGSWWNGSREGFLRGAFFSPLFSNALDCSTSYIPPVSSFLLYVCLVGWEGHCYSVSVHMRLYTVNFFLRLWIRSDYLRQMKN